MATSGKRPVEDLEAEAAVWAARLDAAPDGDHPGLDQWFARDPKNAGALLRAQAALALFEPDTPVAPFAEPAARPFAWKRRALFGGGAVALAASGAALLLTGASGQSYATHTGEFRSVALRDGSSITIDAQSRVEVDFSGTRRDVHLATGKVLFHAAHDPQRPFRVVVGDVVVTDIGTVFQIEAPDRSRAVDILVTEGMVQVDAPSGRLMLGANERARFATEAGGQRPRAMRLSQEDVERRLSWRDGRLELNGETLDAAIAEMNRHNALQLRVADPALGRESLYGSFRLDDAAGFANVIATSFRAEMRSDAKGIVIGQQKRRPAQ